MDFLGKSSQTRRAGLIIHANEPHPLTHLRCEHSSTSMSFGLARFMAARVIDSTGAVRERDVYILKALGRAGYTEHYNALLKAFCC